MVKQEVLDAWQTRTEDARQAIAELEGNLARSRYEQRLFERLLGQASDAETRDIWQIQRDVQQTIIAIDEEHMARQQEELTVCLGMIAAIAADIAQNGA